ncbi:MAG: ABC transporter substrate-binding protein [Oscillospiraceae bacterium]
MNTKKFLSAILAMVLCVTLFASCSSKPEADVPEAGASETVKLGFIGPLSGPASQYGEGCKNGVDMYINELNAKGGINGKQVELIAYDDKSEATESTSAYSRLVDEDGVVAIFGPVTTNPAEAVAALAAEDGFPLITASATGDTLTDIGDTFFRSCFKDSFQGVKMGKYASEVLGLKKVAVLINNSDAYSVGLAGAFVDSCKETGVEVVANESYSGDDADFKSQLTNIAAAKPEALYIPYYYENVYAIAQQAKEVGLNVPFLGGDGFDGLLGIENVDATLLEGFIFTNHYSQEASPKSGEFAAQYETKYGVAPMSFSFTSYDSAQILTDAIAKAASMSSEDIVKALKATDLDCLTSHYTFDADNNPSKDCAMIKIEGGKYVFDQMF